MDTSLNSFYRANRTLAPDIKVRFSLDTRDGCRAVDAFGGRCLGLDLVRLDGQHVVAVLKPGEAVRLKR